MRDAEVMWYLRGRVVLILLLSLTLCIPARGADSFVDFPVGSAWLDYKNYAQFVYEQGIVKGCDTGPKYCPGDKMARDTAAVFLVRAIYWALQGDPEAFTNSQIPYFTDVGATYTKDGQVYVNYYFKYVQKNKELNMTSGCTVSTYCPSGASGAGGDANNLNYQDMAVFVVRANEIVTGGVALDHTAAEGAGAPGLTCSQSPTFTTEGTSRNYYINKLVELHAIDCSGPFVWNGKISRAEMAKWLAVAVMGASQTASAVQLGSAAELAAVREYVRIGGRTLITEGSKKAQVGLPNKFRVAPVSSVISGPILGGLTGGVAPITFYSSRPALWSLVPNERSGVAANRQGQITPANVYSTTALYQPPDYPLDGNPCGSGSNNQCVYSLAIKASDATNTGYATVTLIPKRNPTAGDLSFTPANASVGASGGTGTVSVAAAASTAWTSVSTQPAWISVVSGTSGVGNGNVGYSVGVNPGGYRAGAVSIGGNYFTIEQAGNDSVNLAPQLVFVGLSPVAANTSNATITFDFRDANGTGTFQSIRAVVGGADPLAVPACAVTYSKPANQFVLEDFAGSAATLGTADVQNSNCILKAQGTVATPLDQTTIRVTLQLTFKAAFGGSRTIYFEADDTGFYTSGWLQLTQTWSVPVAPPVVVTASKTAVHAGQVITVSATVNGVAGVPVNWSVVPAGAGGSFASGTANPTQHTVSASMSNGNTSYTYQVKATNPATGDSGTVTLTYGNTAPTVTGVYPGGGSGNGPVTFQLNYWDPDGYGDISVVEAAFTGSDGYTGFQVAYNLAYGTLSVFGNGGGDTACPGGNDISLDVATVFGSSCTYSIASSSGMSLVLFLPVQFAAGSALSGQSVTLSMRVTDKAGVDSGWQNIASWYVTN
ncbi:MAG: hypothetical protein HY820_16735 [Acidobacteria bacterium]|nr:hypothetical protein [Acidobacteriota bacterium]